MTLFDQTMNRIQSPKVGSEKDVFSYGSAISDVNGKLCVAGTTVSLSSIFKEVSLGKSIDEINRTLAPNNNLFGDAMEQLAKYFGENTILKTELKSTVKVVEDEDEDEDEDEEDAITSFTGEYEFLRNDFPANIVFHYVTYPTVEHAFQSCKTSDQDIKNKIQAAPTAREAKQIGRNEVKLINGWDEKKLDFMKMLLHLKFLYPDFRKKLLGTGKRKFIMETKYDDFWGVVNGIGKNYLGKLLMDVRDEVRG